MRRLKVIGLILFTWTLTLQNCVLDIDETNTSFRWVKKGNKLTYNLSKSGVDFPDYRILEITENQGISDNKIFKEVAPEIENDPLGRPYLVLGLFSHVYRLKDGLHTRTCFSCDSNPCFSSKNYLKVPANPTTGQKIPDYLCGDNILNYDMIIDSDSIITVPLGEFKTFVINDTLTKTIKFWNEEVGLIRVDNYNEFFDDTVKLKLSRTNY